MSTRCLPASALRRPQSLVRRGAPAGRIVVRCLLGALVCALTLAAVACDDSVGPDPNASGPDIIWEPDSGRGPEIAAPAPPSDVYGEFCERADTCNALQGWSVSECTESYRECTDELLHSEQVDWEYEIRDCLAEPTCQDFLACYWDAPFC